MLTHLLFPLIPFVTFAFCNDTFSYLLHDVKCKSRFQSPVDQIRHNIISCTDRGRKFTDALRNQCLCVSKPYIRTMGKSRDTHQIRKCFRRSVDQHLHRKICTKLRNSKCTKLRAADVLRFDTKCFRIMEQRHNIFIIQRNRLRIQSGQIFQTTNHRRIIMTENIKFQQVMVDGMVLKMCCNNIGCCVVRRMLDRRERINLLMLWQHDHTTRMLSGCTFHACQSQSDTFHLTTPFYLLMLFVIFVHISKCGFLCQRTNRSRTECLSLSKKFLCISMCFGLILTREIQINIRLFIAIETKECLKRNIVSFLRHQRATLWAFPVRHITTRLSFELFHKIRIKICKITLRTDVVCRKWIYFRDTCHRRNKGRTNRTSAAYQISIAI